MSVRTEWARVEVLAVEVVGEYRDDHGSTLDPGGIALLLGADSVLAVEASDLAQLRALAGRIVRACEVFDAGEAWDEDDY